MLRRVRITSAFLLTLGLLSLGYVHASADSLAFQTGTIFEQPIDPNGKLILSAWRDPDGSDFDQYVWDDFTLPNNGTITEIQWYGGYDPLKFGKGGPVMDFTVSIYPSTASNREPAVANPPLVEYHTAGNADETAFDVFNGTQINVYSFNLPVSFPASAGAKYWIYIVASQQGSLPDWSFIAGTGGSGNHYVKTSGAGGDILYRFMPGDASFTLLGTAAVPVTPTPAIVLTPSNTPAASRTETPATTPVPPQIPSCMGSISALIMLAAFFLRRISK